jgi:transcriptional regulator with XRE-family HTH domain
LTCGYVHAKMHESLRIASEEPTNSTIECICINGCVQMAEKGEMAMPPKPASKAYRDQRRERLVGLGLDGHQLIEQLVADLIGCGCRPREAWRLTYELTQDEVAAQFNQIRGDPDARMRGSRICEYEKWPIGGVRPSVRALKMLAAIYGTTWDRLIDVHDLESMPARDRQAYLDISDLRHSDPLDLSIPRQRRGRRSVPLRSDKPQIDRPIAAEDSMAVREGLTIPSEGPSSERLGGGLPGEVTHFTGRDEPMAELRARLDKHGPQATVVTIYAIDGMAGIGKTAFARHAARELAQRYPDGAIWIDLYGHTPGMTPREPAGALEQMLLQLGMPPETIKADLIGRQDQWRHHTHARCMLIVLDNARTSEQVLPLLPDGPACVVLITSRRKMTGLTDAYPLSLDVLAGTRRSDCSSSWSASTTATTVTRSVRSWPPVVGCR